MGNTHGDTGDVHARHDWSNTAPSIAVVDAIAALENTEPTNLSETLDTRLFDHVDPEALDTIVTGDNEVSISFPLADYTVRIDGNELMIDCG